jgi:hypothetical protein
MNAGQPQLRRRQLPVAERCQALGAHASERLDEILDRIAGAHRSLVRRAIERCERGARPLREHDPRARDPVAALTLDEMADHLARAPCLRPFVRAGPDVGEPGQ